MPGAMRDARHLAAAAAGVGTDRLTLLAPESAPEAALDRLDAFVDRRSGGVSVAHVVGRKSFWGRSFEVDPHVLAPRPETEILIAAALSCDWGRVLDLGTGSGCIAVTLLAERPAADGLATDVSEDALAVARRNAAAHGVAGRLGFLRADWWDGVEGRFDLVVSNPPYIAADEMAGLPREVLAEPALALSPGGDGLDAYRAISAGLAAHLAPGGTCLMEIGAAQGEAVPAILAGAGLQVTALLRDMDGRDRVVRAHHR